LYIPRYEWFLFYAWSAFGYAGISYMDNVTFCVFVNHFYICRHKSNIPATKECLIFIEKGGEIRLCETLATKPPTGGERCQYLIPESREMIKMKREK
jgi:hypothetical protein